MAPTSILSANHADECLKLWAMREGCVSIAVLRIHCVGGQLAGTPIAMKYPCYFGILTRKSSGPTWSQVSTTTSKSIIKRRLGVFLLALAVVILLLIGSVNVSNNAHSKTQPYRLSLVVTSEAPGELKLHYDYGYGMQEAHSRTIQLEAGPNTMLLSISAWKRLRSLSLSATDNQAYEVDQFVVYKDPSKHIVELRNQTLNQGSNEPPLHIVL